MVVPLLALRHRPHLPVQTNCTLHLGLAPKQKTASAVNLTVANPKHSQSTVPQYNRQWPRLRRQPVQAPARPTRLQAQHHLCVPGPSPLKTSAPKRLSQSRLSFSFRIPDGCAIMFPIAQHGTIDAVLTPCLGCHAATEFARSSFYLLPPRLIAPPLPMWRKYRAAHQT